MSLRLSSFYRTGRMTKRLVNRVVLYVNICLKRLVPHFLVRMLCNPAGIEIFDDLSPGFDVFPAISPRNLHNSFLFPKIRIIFVISNHFNDKTQYYFPESGKYAGGRIRPRSETGTELPERGLFYRRDKAPVDGKMVYAVVMSHPDTFCKSEGRIRLII